MAKASGCLAHIWTRSTRPQTLPALPADGYLRELSKAVGIALERLPGHSTIAQVARRSATRSAQAQIRMHAAPSAGAAQLEAWASSEAQGTGLAWREFLAGAASSVLALHALIAAAAAPNITAAEALQLDEAYLPICTLVTLLDGIVDNTQDASSSEAGYISLYNNDDLLAQALAGVAERALRQTRELRNGAHHVMTLSAAVAYYASTPGANSEFAKPLISALRRELGPLVSPPLLVMRTWRAGKRARMRSRGTSVRTGLDA